MDISLVSSPSFGGSSNSVDTEAMLRQLEKQKETITQQIEDLEDSDDDEDSESESTALSVDDTKLQNLENQLLMIEMRIAQEKSKSERLEAESQQQKQRRQQPEEDKTAGEEGSGGVNVTA